MKRGPILQRSTKKQTRAAVMASNPHKEHMYNQDRTQVSALEDDLPSSNEKDSIRIQHETPRQILSQSLKTFLAKIYRATKIPEYEDVEARGLDTLEDQVNPGVRDTLANMDYASLQQLYQYVQGTTMHHQTSNMDNKHSNNTCISIAAVNSPPTTTAPAPKFFTLPFTKSTLHRPLHNVTAIGSSQVKTEPTNTRSLDYLS